jgi:arginine N-succinyltransferase
MLMATQPKRFQTQVVSELRGVVSADGASPFWEAVGRHFFRMDFNEADRLSAVTDNQFILDLMPQHPIYVDLLPASARAVIGQCHEAGRGARSLLEWEGFTFSNVVDIFDGGPLLSVSRDAIRTLRESRRVRVNPGAAAGGRRALLATPKTRDFRCVAAPAIAREGAAEVDAAAIAALGLDPGAEALIWVSDAD